MIIYLLTGLCFILSCVFVCWLWAVYKEEDMAKRVPPKFRRLPTLNETASVLEPGAPEFITTSVRVKVGEEPQTIVYIRQDTLPEKLRKDVGKAIVEKCLGLPMFQTLGNLGQRLLLGEDTPAEPGNKTDGPSDPEGPDLATEGSK